MNARKIGKIEKELYNLRRKSVVTTAELQSLAKSLGRRKLTGAQVRGKEPGWVSNEFPQLRPISIPFHGNNSSVAPGTAKNILNDLEEDIFRLKLKYPKDEKNKEGDIQEYNEYEN